MLKTGKLKLLTVLVLIIFVIFSTELANARARRSRGSRSGGRGSRSGGRGGSRGNDVEETPIGGETTDEPADDEPVPPDDRDYKYRKGSKKYEEEYPEDDKDGEAGTDGEADANDDKDTDENDEYYDEKGNKIKMGKRKKHHYDSKDFDDQEKHPVDEEDLSLNDSDSLINITLHNILYEDLMQSNCQVEKLDKGTERLVISFTNIKIPKGVTFIASMRSSNQLWKFNAVPPTPFSTNRYYYVSLNKSSGVHNIVIPKVENDTYHEIIVRPLFINSNIVYSDSETFQKMNPTVKGQYEDPFLDLVKRVVFRTGKDDDKCNQKLLNDYDQYLKLKELKQQHNKTTFMFHYEKGEVYHKLKKHSELNDFNPAFLDLNFRLHMLEHKYDKVMQKLSKSVYKFHHKIFTQKFIDLLTSELQNARQIEKTKSGLIQFSSPNKLHKDGFNLQELGMEHIFEVFFHTWLGNLTASIPPFYTICGDMLDTMEAYIMRYTPGKSDSELQKHMDQSDITFNLCLHNDDPKGSGIVFKGVRDDTRSSKKDEATVYLKTGQAVLHVGQNWHHTTQVTKGEKVHLLLWFKSQYCRESPKQIYFSDCDGLMTYEKEKCDMNKSEL